MSKLLEPSGTGDRSPCLSPTRISPDRTELEMEEYDPPTTKLNLKRRRVLRACDECRQKKVKCDGQHPCQHCCAYDYHCSYETASHRSKNRPPAYLLEMEKKLERAENFIKRALPGIDIDDIDIDSLTPLSPGQSTPFALKTDVSSPLNNNNVAPFSDPSFSFQNTNTNPISPFGMQSRVTYPVNTEAGHSTALDTSFENNDVLTFTSLHPLAAASEPLFSSDDLAAAEHFFQFGSSR